MIVSLRARLLAGLLALTAAGMLIAGGVTYAEQRSFAYQRVDDQTRDAPFLLGRELGATATATTMGAVGEARRAPATTRSARPRATEDPDALFERFWRAEGGRERGKGGAGLGLAIVAGIVDAHDGRVRAYDADGGGAAFVVELPPLRKL